MLATLPDTLDAATGGSHAVPSIDDHAFLRKLGEGPAPTAIERSAMLKVLGANVRILSGRTALIEEGMAPRELHIVLSGWACRVAQLDRGRRHIVALYVPGDICEPHAFDIGALDQTIAAVNGLRVASIGRTTFDVLREGCPPFVDALRREAVSASAVQRRWTINTARRSAHKRVAHFMCDLIARLDAVGLKDGDMYDWPISQGDAADACGLTVEHVNRVLQTFRGDGLISLKDQTLVVLNRAGLAAIAGFEGGR